MTELQLRVDVIGLGGRRRSEGRCSADQVALGAKGGAEVVMGLGKLRVSDQRFLAGDDGLIELPGLDQQAGQIVVSRGVLGRKPN